MKNQENGIYPVSDRENEMEEETLCRQAATELNPPLVVATVLHVQLWWAQGNLCTSRYTDNEQSKLT